MMYIMNHKGWMEVICGSMFSGKSEELIRRVKRATYGNQKIRPRHDTLMNLNQVRG